MTITQQNCIHE